MTEFRITKVTDGAELARQIEPRMANLGRAVATRMQRLVPKRTWALHDSIDTETERSGSNVTTTVSFGTGYGLFVERGTSKMAAQPFARPALLQSRARDLNFGGGGPQTRGVKLEVARERRRARRLEREADRRERESEY